MKLYSLLLAFAMTIGAVSCSSETTTHDASQIPEKARDLISQNFTSAISLVQTEKQMGQVHEYEVTLTNGTEISFNGSGEWESIDTPAGTPVPAGLVPTAIARYVAEKHAGAFIVGIEKNKKGFEIELSNNVDIYFDATGNFLKYGD